MLIMMASLMHSVLCINFPREIANHPQASAGSLGQDSTNLVPKASVDHLPDQRCGGGLTGP